MATEAMVAAQGEARYGRYDLKALLLCVALLGCHAPPPVVLPAPPPVLYRPVMPQFEARPLVYPCTLQYSNGQEKTKTCLKVLEQDVRDIILELKKACMALGWMARECEVVYQPNPMAADKPYDMPGTPGSGM